MRTGERGFTYLLLLFVLAAGGAGLAALGTHWQTLAQRERETELLWRGQQILQALERYAAVPGATPRLPRALTDLLQDERLPTPGHWLRELYADPFTGAADWVLLRDAEGGIVGVASRSQRAALKRHGLPPRVAIAETGAPAPTVGDWRFVASAAQTASSAATTSRRSRP